MGFLADQVSDEALALAWCLEACQQRSRGSLMESRGILLRQRGSAATQVGRLAALLGQWEALASVALQRLPSLPQDHVLQLGNPFLAQRSQLAACHRTLMRFMALILEQTFLLLPWLPLHYATAAHTHRVVRWYLALIAVAASTRTQWTNT